MSGWTVDAGHTARRSLRDARARAGARLAAAAAWPAAPAVVLGLAMLVVAVATALVSKNVVAHTFDEDLYKASAAHYAHDGLPSALLHDVFARGPARLYSLLIMPFYAALPANAAVRAAHVLGCFLFASAAIPTYLLARVVVRSRWAAVLAGVGAILVPWTALSSALYSENLAYPLFLWGLLALWRAISAPTAIRDFLALASIFLLIVTRTQFGILLPTYLALIVVFELRRTGRWRFGPREGLLRLAGAYPWTSALVVLLGGALLLRAAQGHLHEDVQRLFGGYAEIQDRKVLGQQYSTAVAAELMAVGFGTGMVATVVGGAWYGSALARRVDERSRDFALLVTVVLAVLVAFTVYAQGGWLGNATEERYFIYLVPPLWVGTAAALERRVVTRGALAISGLVALFCVAAADNTDVFDNNYVFLAPIHATLAHLVPVWLAKIGQHSHILGTLSGLDFRVLLAFALLVVVLWLWGRGRTARGVVVAGALAVQVAFAGYAWAAIDGHVPGGGRIGGNFHQLGWLDRAAHGQAVSWIDNQDVHDGTVARNQQVDTVFFNSQVRGFVSLPELNRPLADPTLAGLPDTAAKLSGAGLPSGLALGALDSPVFQIDAPVVERDPAENLELLRVGPSPRVLWSMVGLASDNWLESGESGRLRVGPGVKRVTIQFARPAVQNAQLSVQLGRQHRTAAIKPGATPLVWSFDVCGPATGTITGSADPDPQAGGRALVGAPSRVILTRGRC